MALVAALAPVRCARVAPERELRPGVEFTLIGGEPWCRLGSSSVAVLRVDPRRTRLRARSYARLAPPRMLTVLEWRELTHATAVFNAGQYYPDFSYMGVLVCGGDTVSARPHPGFQAALVADSARAHVLDLARTPLSAPPRWREVAQSFMLFDRTGGARVRRTPKIANRTVVGEDERGWIVICVSEGAYTLADFAEMLRRAPLRLTQAMSMDGGLESELVVATPGFRYASFGDWPADREPSAPGAIVPLPAVITLEDR